MTKNTRIAIRFFICSRMDTCDMVVGSMKRANDRPDCNEIISADMLAERKTSRTTKPITAPMNISLQLSMNNTKESCSTEKPAFTRSKRRYVIRREIPPLRMPDTMREEKSGIIKMTAATRKKTSRNFWISNVMAIFVIYLTYNGILAIRFCVNEIAKFIIHGNRTMRHKDMTSIFGTNTSVISWICVAAWKILIRRPTTIDAIRSGDIRIRVDLRKSLNIWITRSWLICLSR